MTDARAVPFYCPYCADEDIRPAGPEGGRFACRSCGRVWQLRFLGLAAEGEDSVPSGTEPAG